MKRRVETALGLVLKVKSEAGVFELIIITKWYGNLRL